MILVVGLAQFIHFEPSGQHTGLAAKIVGVYDYDPKTRQTTGPNKDHFQTSEPFAAEVDWTSLPPDLVVGAQWFSGGFTIDAGGVGPARAASLSEHSVVPVNFGCHPTSSHRYYNYDDVHLRLYLKAASTEKGFQDYMRMFVLEPTTQETYMSRVQNQEWIGEI